MVKDLNLPVKESLQVSLAVAMAVFDAGIAAWEMKYCECHFSDSPCHHCLSSDRSFSSSIL